MSENENEKHPMMSLREALEVYIDEIQVYKRVLGLLAKEGWTLEQHRVTEATATLATINRDFKNESNYFDIQLRKMGLDKAGRPENEELLKLPERD